MTKHAQPPILARYYDTPSPSEMEGDDLVVTLGDNETLSGKTKAYMPSFGSTDPNEGDSWVYRSGIWTPEAASAGKTVYENTKQDSAEIAGTVVDDVFSIKHELAAGDLDGEGRSLSVVLSHKNVGGLSAGNFTVKLLLGGVVIYTTPTWNPPTAATNYGTYLFHSRVQTAGASGKLYTQMTFGFSRKNAQLAMAAPTLSSAIDLTQAKDLEVSVSIDTNLNKMTLQQFYARIGKP